jgi:hypothetical protein
LNEDLIKQIIAVPGGAALVGWFVYNSIKTMIDQDKKIRTLEMMALQNKMEDLDSRLQHTNQRVFEEMMPKMDLLKDAVIRNTAKQEAMQESITRHASLLETTLPAIKHEIGKLSMYWKQTGNK